MMLKMPYSRLELFLIDLNLLCFVSYVSLVQ